MYVYMYIYLTFFACLLKGVVLFVVELVDINTFRKWDVHKCEDIKGVYARLAFKRAYSSNFVDVYVCLPLKSMQQG